jgi:cytochrome oxidase Cu insertion factor (SCO1/SenC/PrrC family)
MSTDAEIRPSPQSSRLRAGWIATALAAAALLGVGIGVAVRLSRDSSTSAPAASTPLRNGLHGQATWAAGALPAPPISTLVDQAGRRFSLASLHGRTVTIAFFDSYCTQACPLEGRALAVAERSLPVAERPVLVVVSVNPRDTPASTRRAIHKWGLAGVAGWHWLRGTHALLARVWKAYHIFVAPPANGDIAHTEALYLIDRRGDERSAYLYPFAPRFVTGDLATLSRSGRS